MTAKELHILALSRDKTLRSNCRHGTGLTLKAFRRWLDQQVQAGLLERHRGHYRLTDEGYAVAAELNDLTARS